MAKIQNRKRLSKRLRAIPAAVKPEIRQALAESADEITDAQKRLVPRDEGDLANSIGSTFGSYQPANANVRGVQAQGGGDPDLRVVIHAGDAKAFYAAFVEFGVGEAVAGGKFAGAIIPARPAQPFFYPPFRAYRKRAKARVTRAVTRAAKKAAKE